MIPNTRKYLFALLESMDVDQIYGWGGGGGGGVEVTKVRKCQHFRRTARKCAIRIVNVYYYSYVKVSELQCFFNVFFN